MEAQTIKPLEIRPIDQIVTIHSLSSTYETPASSVRCPAPCPRRLPSCLPLSIRPPAQANAGRPKLIVIVVIHQFCGDYLNRDSDEFKVRGFRLFMDQGARFTNCYFDYANPKTDPGHSTIGTSAYSDGHGIESNEWWDPGANH